MGWPSLKPAKTVAWCFPPAKPRNCSPTRQPTSPRLAQTKLVLSEVVQNRKLKGTKVYYAVSSQSVFTRFVKLPSVGEEQVDQIVGFEAQQNVPYPINEVVWDYQLVDSGDSSQVEVVIVAVKADLLDDINDSVEQAGLKTTLVDVALMALYNAFRYNYSDVQTGSLVIDIGSRTTNLIFIEPNKVFSRSIPNGGSTITQQIAKEFSEPFQQAEERKEARRLRQPGRGLRRAGRPGCGPCLEDDPQLDDPPARGNRAFHQLLPFAAEWQPSRARVSQRRQRHAALHA